MVEERQILHSGGCQCGAMWCAPNFLPYGIRIPQYFRWQTAGPSGKFGKNQGDSHVKRIVIVLGLVAGMITIASAQTPEVSPTDAAPMHLPHEVQKGFDLYQTVAVYDFRAFAFDPATRYKPGS